MCTAVAAVALMAAAYSALAKSPDPGPGNSFVAAAPLGPPPVPAA
ncbi:MAG: hypothetical protein ACXW3D_10550 [Caulobacteraceae bacterium]